MLFCGFTALYQPAAAAESRSKQNRSQRLTQASVALKRSANLDLRSASILLQIDSHQRSKIALLDAKKLSEEPLTVPALHCADSAGGRREWGRSSEDSFVFNSKKRLFVSQVAFLSALFRGQAVREKPFPLLVPAALFSCTINSMAAEVLYSFGLVLVRHPVTG